MGQKQVKNTGPFYIIAFLRFLGKSKDSIKYLLFKVSVWFSNTGFFPLLTSFPSLFENNSRSMMREERDTWNLAHSRS